MKEEFISLQIKRIRRNIIILIVILILVAIFIGFNIELGLIPAGILLFAFMMHPIGFLNRVNNIKFYSVNKSVSVYGNFNYLSQNINSELLRASSVKYGNVIITDSWILKLNTFSLNVINMSDVVWVYHNITTQKQGAIVFGGVVPAAEVGKTFAVIINSKNPITPTIRISASHMHYMDDSKELALEGMEKQQRMRNIFEQLQQRNSCAIFGYSRELYKMWSDDKNRFIKEVKLGGIRQNF